MSVPILLFQTRTAAPDVELPVRDKATARMLGPIAPRAATLDTTKASF
jgi:hypothetical protein